MDERARARQVRKPPLPKPEVRRSAPGFACKACSTGCGRNSPLRSLR